MQSFSGALEKALADFERQRDTGRVSYDADQIVKDAGEGRVADLFFAENDQFKGASLNAAALETVRHGGHAFPLETRDLPESRELGQC
jgi:hypothetical protein